MQRLDGGEHFGALFVVETPGAVMGDPQADETQVRALGAEAASDHVRQDLRRRVRRVKKFRGEVQGPESEVRVVVEQHRRRGERLR